MASPWRTGPAHSHPSKPHTGFRLGDMVWAKVTSHPWWPGQIFDPASASSLARKCRRVGHVLVAFFGDDTFGWFLETELIPFEVHFAQNSKQTTASSFVMAVDDALEEVNRRVRLGLSCPCQNAFQRKHEWSKLRSCKGPTGLSLDKHLSDVREAFVPANFLSFVKEFARAPFSSSRHSLRSTKAVAQMLALRVATFTACNSSYEEFLTNYVETKDRDYVESAGNSLDGDFPDMSDKGEGPYTPERSNADFTSPDKRVRAGVLKFSSESKSRSCKLGASSKKGWRKPAPQDNVCARDYGKLVQGLTKCKPVGEETLGELLKGDAEDDKKTFQERREDALKTEASDILKLTEDIGKERGSKHKRVQDALMEDRRNAVNAGFKKRASENVLTGECYKDRKLKENQRKEEKCFKEKRLQDDMNGGSAVLRSEEGVKGEMLEKLGFENNSGNMVHVQEFYVDEQTEDETADARSTNTDTLVKDTMAETFGGGSNLQHSSDANTPFHGAGSIDKMITLHIGASGGSDAAATLEMQVDEDDSSNLVVKAAECPKQEMVGQPERKTQGAVFDASDRRTSLPIQYKSTPCLSKLSLKRFSTFRRLVRGPRGSQSCNTLDEENIMKKGHLCGRDDHCQVTEFKFKNGKLKVLAERQVRLNENIHHSNLESSVGQKCSMLCADLRKIEGKNLHQSDATCQVNCLQQFLQELLDLAADPLCGDNLETLSRVLKFREAAFERDLDYSCVPSVLPVYSASNQDFTLKEDVEQVLSFHSLRPVPGYSDTNNDRVAVSDIGAPKQGKQKRIHEDNLEDAAKRMKVASVLSSTMEISSSSIPLRPTADAKVLLQRSKGHKQLEPVNHHSSKIANERDGIRSSSSTNKNAGNAPLALYMKFPQGFALPSEAQLRATFVHFGSLDPSGTRIYCNSSCAQVIFRRACDAEKALRFVQKNNVFGQAAVSFRLKQLHPAKETMPSHILPDSSKDGESIEHDERLPSPMAKKQVSKTKDDQIPCPWKGQLVSGCSTDSRSQSSRPLNSSPRKIDDPPGVAAENVAFATLQLSSGTDSEHSLPSADNILKSDQIAFKKGGESLTGLQSPKFASDIGDQMMTLLQQVSALVGSSGLVP